MQTPFAETTDPKLRLRLRQLLDPSTSAGGGEPMFPPPSSFVSILAHLWVQAKTTKKIVLTLQCQSCKHYSRHPIKRCKHFEIGEDKKGKGTSLFSFVFFFQILGAATTCYVALHPNLRSVTGKYFDEELSRRLWYLSEKMVKANE
ncbi:uncharacterized protein LOC122003708 [Zingiber officinale]|uniref:uncharacterized protein LOC122003708 n=1 Tax=Zingiber officinale TaxID=94328 RepID=UPI001C4AD7FB|nr:uncharacterized protein LOC122003708 [Zingiber officinale]